VPRFGHCHLVVSTPVRMHAVPWFAFVGVLRTRLHAADRFAACRTGHVAFDHSAPRRAFGWRVDKEAVYAGFGRGPLTVRRRHNARQPLPFVGPRDPVRRTGGQHIAVTLPLIGIRDSRVFPGSGIAREGFAYFSPSGRFHVWLFQVARPFPAASAGAMMKVAQARMAPSSIIENIRGRRGRSPCPSTINRRTVQIRSPCNVHARRIVPRRARRRFYATKAARVRQSSNSAN
jgi:hypothetical protein